MKTINAKEFNRILKNEKNVLIDVREKDEFSGGHIKGAVNIPMNSIPNEIDYLEKNLKEGKSILVYCLSGGRSNGVGRWLKERNINVIDLHGGIMSWPFEIE